MARCEECVDPRGGIAEDRLDCRGHEHLRHKHREVGKPAVMGQFDGHRVGGGSGFKADGQEDHLPRRFGFGQPHRIERRIDDPHISPPRLGRQQTLLTARHPQHVSKRTENRLRPQGDRDRMVEICRGRDAHRAARPMDHLDRRRQQLIEAVMDQRMRLPSADFHD